MFRLCVRQAIGLIALFGILGPLLSASEMAVDPGAEASPTVAPARTGPGGENGQAGEAGGEAEAEEALPPPYKPDPLEIGEDVKASTYKHLKGFESKWKADNKEMNVWHDVENRRVFVEGRFIQPEGLLEFLAVARGGKTHESVIEMYCRPVHLFYSMLICKFENYNNLQGEGAADTPKGDPIRILVEFKNTEGKVVRKPIEELAFNQLTKKAMRPVSFAFTGSRYVKDPDTNKTVYLADLEKDIVTCYRTEWALFNSPLNTGMNDDVYEINKKACPPANTPCLLIFVRGKVMSKEELDDAKGAKLVQDKNTVKQNRVGKEGGAKKDDGEFSPIGVPEAAPSPDSKNK